MKQSPSRYEVQGIGDSYGKSKKRTTFNGKALIVLFALLIAACQRDPLETMPEFAIILADGVAVLNTSDISEDKMILLVHFDPDCRECQEEAELIAQHMDELKDVNIYFISAQDFDKITLFRDYFKLGDYSNIKFGRDTGQFMARHFQTGVTPLLALYDSRKRLKGVVKGKSDLSRILATVRKNQ